MAKTSNELLLDALIRHQIYLLRYSGYVRNRMTTILNASEDDIARRIRDRLQNTKGLRTPVEWRRLQSLLAGIEGVRRQAWKDATAFLTEQAVELSYQEPILLDSIVKSTLPVVVTTVMPTTRLLKAIALSRPFEGKVLKDWAATMEADDLRRIHAAVQAGMVAGEGSATIARRVVGTAALNGEDGVTQTTRRQVQAITRTAVQHIANSARNEWINDNADIIESEQFVATLDSRTTPQCRALDGKIFEVDRGPQAPLHFQCRSLRIAVIDGTLAGNRPAKPTTEKQLVREYAEINKLGDVRNRDGLPRGEKGAYDRWARQRIRQLVGPVPASETYQTWLTKQSTAFQNEVLGATRGKLFREGGLKLDQFVNRNGDELTLKELAGKHADAFRAAGFNPDNF